jgi:hypothetical protein
MSKFKRQIKAGHWALGKIVKFPVTIDKWYGRLGNNIQQIAIAILYAQQHGRRAIIPEHPQIKAIQYGKRKLWSDRLKNKNRFFFFTPSSEPVIDVELSYEAVCQDIQKVAREWIAPHFKFNIDEPLDQDVLVIHLRGGDVFDSTGEIHPGYVQNPLSFYKHLIRHFRKTILVCEPGFKNPIIPLLKEIPSVTVQSSTIEADFQTLLRAQNIATSGVGTFAIAAALCSQNLKNLFCTDRYLTEHLNPEMIKEAHVHCLRLGDDYLKPGEWDGSSQAVSHMLTYEVNENYFLELFNKISAD